MVGAIIGRGGQTIRQITQQTRSVITGGPSKLQHQETLRNPPWEFPKRVALELVGWLKFLVFISKESWGFLGVSWGFPKGAFKSQETGEFSRIF